MRKHLYPILTLLLLSFAQVGSAYEFKIIGEVDFAILPIPIPGLEVQIRSEDDRFQQNVRTDENGLFSFKFDIEDGTTLLFIVETTDLCSGVKVSEEVKSLEGEVFVQLLICAPDDFPCQANFEYFPLDELSLQFLDVSFVNTTSWEWDFGDGKTSTEQSPIHTYDSLGTYSVTFRIMGNDSCQSSITREVALGENPCLCPEYYLPVCVENSDGQIDTFANPCFAQCAGYEYFVSCNPSCDCPDTIDPVCVWTIEGNLTYKNSCQAACEGFDTTTYCDTTCVCPEIYDPVCVITDEGAIIEFSNECFARCAGYDAIVPCEPDCYCDRKYDPVCIYLASGELLQFANACLAECAGYFEYVSCDTSCHCDGIYDPVCFVTDAGDVLTFANLCQAECRGYPDATSCDACECPEFILPVCVLGSDGDIIQFDNPCLAKCAGYHDFIPCESDCDCAGIVDPVCVILDDGSVQQYSSACEAICNGFNVFYNCSIVCDCPNDNDPVCVELTDGTTRRFPNPCWAGCAGFSDYETCKVSNPDPGDEEHSLVRTLQVQAFPNPFYDRFTLGGEVKGSGDIQVIVYDLLGQQVLTNGLRVKGRFWALEMDATKLAAGTYIAQIKDGRQRETIKLIRN